MRILATLAACAALISAPAFADHHEGDDHAAVQAAIDDLYAVISGPVGEPRDFDAMRDMFLPGAVMGAVSAGPDGEGRATTFDVEGYIERSGAWLVENGFTEAETRNEIEIWGEIAYVRTAYEGVTAINGETVVTGVNFVTLFKHEGEWKIASILWRQQTDDIPVEAAFD